MNTPIRKPYNLTVNFVTNPIGVDSKSVKLCWMLSHELPNVYQTAYRLVLYDDKGNVVYDSGKMESEDNCAKIENLKERTRYYWKIKWWDNYGNESDFSDIAFFETGIIAGWRAKWIISKGRAKKTFKINKGVKYARAYVTGLGYYELYINGRKVDEDRVLTPIWSEYNSYVYYSTYDITQLLKQGDNIIGIESGRGRYIKQYGYDEKYKVLAQVHIVYEDDSEDAIITDDSWVTKESPIIYNDIYNGTVYDERKEEKDWLTSTSTEGWEKCTIDDSFHPRLISDYLTPPIRKTKGITPKSIKAIDDNTFIVDFGQNFSGVVRLSFLCERPGQEVVIRHAEVLTEDGRLNTKNLRSAKAEDKFICAEPGFKVFEPKFTYHGFRYAEVKGVKMLNDSVIEGIVIHSDVPHVGGIVFLGDEVLNDIHRITLWSLRSNFMGIPTDCPQRDERMGWLGDSNLTIEVAMFNLWAYGFYREWIRQIIYNQKADGSVPDVVPPFWQLYPADPAWGDEIVYLPYMLYLFYGDKEVLEDYYENMKKWVNFLLQKTEDGIVKFSKYGDWVPPMHIKSADTPGELVSTWILLKELKIMGYVAEILGKKDDSEEFNRLFESIRNYFNKHFLRGENNQVYYIQGSQTSQVLPLYLDIITPQDKRAKVLERLVWDVKELHDRHLNTGIIGTRYLLPVLCDYDYEDLAYDVATQTSYPSWGYMIKEGATTLWERWEYLTGTAMNSHNHIMLGSIDTWFYEYLAGIRPDEAGFKKIIIKPCFPTRLKGVIAHTITPRGPVSISWIREDRNRIDIKLSTPPSTTTELILHDKNVDQIYLDEELVFSRNGKIADIVKLSDSKIKIRLGNGEFRLKIVLNVGK